MSFLIGLATFLAVLTYLEDATRLYVMWEEQLSFVQKHSGLPYTSIAASLLIAIALAQCSTPLLVLPPSLSPTVARLHLYICVAVALSVIFQPYIFNQMTNFQLISLSAAQLGALGLIFGEAHAVLHPQRHPFAAFISTPMPAEAGDAVQWVRLCSRLLLTVDLTVVFTTRLMQDLFPVASLLGTALDAFPLVGGVLVWLGFKTEACATAVALACLVDTFHRFPFWTGTPDADFLRFHFFQAMTPVGGLLLLAALGPGRLSVDFKAKRT